MIKVNKLIFNIIIAIQQIISLHYGMILSDRISYNYFQGELFFLTFFIIWFSFALSGFLIIKKYILSIK